MASLKICVQKQRKDGTWPVYIRVTHRGGIVHIFHHRPTSLNRGRAFLFVTSQKRSYYHHQISIILGKLR